MPKLLEQACGSLCCKIVYGVLVEGLLNFMSGEGGSHIFWVSQIWCQCCHCLLLLGTSTTSLMVEVGGGCCALKKSRFTKMTVNATVCLFRLSLPSSSTATFLWTLHYTNARTERKRRTDNQNCLTIEPMNPKCFVWNPPPSTERCAFETSAP